MMNFSNASITDQEDKEGHWYTILWNVFDFLLLIPTLFGNGLIIISIVRFRKLRHRMYLLVGNLAFSDLLVGAFLIPFDLVADVVQLNSNKYFCLIKMSIFVLSLGGSCCSLLLISVERCAAIVFPLQMRTFFTRRRLCMMIMVGWIVMLGLSMSPLLGWNTYMNNQTDCQTEKLWANDYEMLINWALIVSMLASFILYIIVVRIALKRVTARRLRGEMNIHHKSEKDLQKLITMVIVMGVFAVCWFPYVAMIVTMTFHDTPLIRFIRKCCIIPGMINSSINWLIYGFRNRDFKSAFKALLKCHGKKGLLRETYRRQNQSYTSRADDGTTCTTSVVCNQENQTRRVFTISS